MFWLCKAAHRFDHKNAVAERKDMERICFEEAEYLGLTYVVIRQGVHNESVVYENGMPATFWDIETQSWLTRVETVPWHMTVWMGESREKLLIHGHIFVDVDGTTRRLSKMSQPGNKSREYWSLTMKELPLK